MSDVGPRRLDWAMPADRHGESQIEFLRGLADVNTAIAGDVVEIGANTWAIHGSIAVDGEVILAEYETADQARIVLAMLAARSPLAQPATDRT
jgi:hypothetical protein